MMSDPQPEEILQARKLRNEFKFKEAFKIIEDLEKKESLSPQELVWTLLEKGWIYASSGQIKKTVEVGEHVFKLARKHEMIVESIWARILKAHIMFSAEHFRGGSKAFRSLTKCEKLFASFKDQNSLTILNIKGIIFSMKAWFYLFTSQIDMAVEAAEKSLNIRKKTGTKLDIAVSNRTLGRAYWRHGDLDTALEYATQSLDIIEELDYPPGISQSSHLIGDIYLSKGELTPALDYLNRSLSVKEINDTSKITILESLATLYYSKNELNESLKCLNEAKAIAQEFNLDILLARCLNGLGMFYHLKGEHDKAIEVLESSLVISERVKLDRSMQLVTLTLVYLDKGSREQAQKYMRQLEKISELFPSIYTSINYELAKAMTLKTSGRTRNRAEAELLLKKIIEDTDKIEFQFEASIISHAKMLCLVNLCDLYLEDLSFSNDLEVLEDINPLINQMIKFADEKHSVIFLAETKLLQAKLALIQLRTTEAEKLLVEAEQIAETHEFDLLAVKISTEHDALLTQLDVWNDLKNRDAPVTERVKLASVDGVIDRLQRKRAIELSDLVDEESTLLLIIAEGGVLLFSHAFTDEWERDDELFSSFLSAFTSFSDEFFSEELDRVKFGQYTVLMGSVGPFSVCYLYKGQTYSAKKKLNKFTEGIHNITAIWQLLEKFYKTSQVLVLNDSPQLESLITEIFVGNTQKNSIA